MTYIRMLTRICFIVVMLFTHQEVFSQNYEEQIKKIRDESAQTRSNINNLRQTITDLQKQLTTASSKEEAQEREFEKLNREIAVQDRLLRQLRNEARLIRNEIGVTQQSYKQLEVELGRLVKSYQKSLSHIYKHGRTNELSLILTSGSFNQMLVRAYYLRKFDETRQAQAEDIRAAQEKLKAKEASLAAAREKTLANEEETKKETSVLAETKKKQEATLKELRSNTKFLERKLEASKKSAAQLESALRSAQAEIDRIARLQREEAERLARLAKARENPNVEQREEEVARNSVPIYTGEMLSEEEMNTISSSFRSAAGRLPWPVDRGEVVTPFGTVVNPLYGTKTDNPGVEISATPGSPVKAVHRGIVASVLALQKYGETVMINHGTHMTAYGNLSRILVKTGTVVNAGDVIGLSGNPESLMGPVLFFMVRDVRGPQNVNPETWLRAR